MRHWTLSYFLKGAILLAVFSMDAQGGASGRNDLDEPLSLFFETKYALALPMFERIAARDRESAEALTWLAETYRRLGRTREAIVTARKALGYSPCSSFAHLVLAQSSYPDADTVSAHVTAAAACDSTDPNAWLMMWGEAIRRADPALYARCLSKLVETGFLTEAALAYGRVELRTLPEHAIRITNGDMDTYPAQAVQVTEHFRPDVAVIEREHLGMSWSARFIREHQHVALPIPDKQLEMMKDSIDASGHTITACFISGGRAVTMGGRTRPRFGYASRRSIRLPSPVPGRA